MSSSRETGILQKLADGLPITTSDAGFLARRLRQASYKEDVARDRLEQAIQDARSGGLSLRAIAEAAGMSHEKVRLLLKAKGPS